MIQIKHRYTGAVILEVESLEGANLCNAALRSAALRSAALRSAALTGANLRSADLTGADLRSADLRSADLRSADLYGADLTSADLTSANLRSADLTSADLTSANLRSADLTSADLTGANLDEVNISFFSIVPESGAFVGYKKLQNEVIAKLQIPASAGRVNAIGSRKCRASKVKVLAMYGANEAYDSHTGKTLYKVGQYVTPDAFDPDVRVECSHGIHFFITRQEAEDY